MDPERRNLSRGLTTLAKLGKNVQNLKTLSEYTRLCKFDTQNESNVHFNRFFLFLVF